MKVYIAEVWYDNGEQYEDHESWDKTLAVCSSYEKALEIINNTTVDYGSLNVIDHNVEDKSENSTRVRAIEEIVEDWFDNDDHCEPDSVYTWYFYITEVEIDEVLFDKV